MPDDPGLFARFWEYLLAAGVYWWAGLAVLLSLERIAERSFYNFWKKHVDPWFTPQRRKQALIVFAILAFLYGNFRAFDDEIRSVRADTIEIGRLTGQLDAAKTLADDRQKELDNQALQIAALQSQIAQLQPKAAAPEETRNPDGLYQLGTEVATVTGASIDRGHSLVSFQTVRSSGNLDSSKDIEYRNLVLRCDGLAGAPPRNVTVGVFVGMTAGAQCTILRLRQ